MTIPVVCFCSFLFGNWSLKWNGKHGTFQTNYYFVLTACFMLVNVLYLFYASLRNKIEDSSITANPQYLILYAIYLNYGVLILNRLANARHGSYFANELKATCCRTVESGRNLLEFWFRMAMAALTVYLTYYKYRTFSDMALDSIVAQMTVPLACCVYVGTTMECQYSAACHALSGRLAAVNRRSGSWAAARSLAAAAEAHGRLARLARLFNGEYGAPIFLTTVNLLLNQIYAMNDVVSVFVAGETFEPAYVEFTYAHNAIVWTVSWLRLWWICYRVDGLTGQVHLTAKIMLEKDINAYPGNTRQLAFDFLDQLLHRHIRITAWGFYDVNKELLFMVLGYQCGLCLICTQFTTSGIQLINSLTTIQKNYTSQSSQ